MAIVKRVAPVSACKVGLVVYGLLGLVAGALCSAVALAGVQFAPHAHMPRAAALLALILCPMVWGTFGGLVNAVSAVLYNLASNWIGGLEVEIQ